MKKLLCSAAALSMMATGAFAQAATELSPSVLERLLNNVSTAVGSTGVGGGGDISSVLSNVAANQNTLITDIADSTNTTDQVFGNIDSSVDVSFLVSTLAILSASNSDGSPVGPDLTSAATVSLQEMKGTLGDITTLVLGASLDATASITGGANQTLNESSAMAGSAAGGDASALAQTTAQEAVLASNLALSTVDLNSAVSVSADSYALEASAISTSAIGAVGGGSIVNGEIDKLNSAIFSVVGSTG